MESRKLIDIELGELDQDESNKESEKLSLFDITLNAEQCDRALAVIEKMRQNRAKRQRRKHDHDEGVGLIKHYGITTLILGSIVTGLLLLRKYGLESFEKSEEVAKYNQMQTTSVEDWMTSVSLDNQTMSSCHNDCYQIKNGMLSDVGTNLDKTLCHDDHVGTVLNCTLPIMLTFCENILDSYCSKEPDSLYPLLLAPIILLSICCGGSSVGCFLNGILKVCGFPCAISTTGFKENIFEPLSIKDEEALLPAEKKFINQVKKARGMSDISEHDLEGIREIREILKENFGFTRRRQQHEVFLNNQALQQFLSVAYAKENSKNRETPLFQLFRADINGQIRRKIVEEVIYTRKDNFTRPNSYDLILRSPVREEPIIKGNLYLYEVNNRVVYTVRKPNGEVVRDALLNLSDKSIQLKLGKIEDINDYKEEILEATQRAGHTLGRYEAPPLPTLQMIKWALTFKQHVKNDGKAEADSTAKVSQSLIRQ